MKDTHKYRTISVNTFKYDKQIYIIKTTPVNSEYNLYILVENAFRFNFSVIILNTHTHRKRERCIVMCKYAGRINKHVVRYGYLVTEYLT